ncbi:centromere protein Scm3-domain-containing protein [Aspergillus pseudoustus]|uniref:Centromere protein Scm3-domain-containing protein n=1 Tax=Aspergillus pseudoustus TaxID=1810923 RepID=A0ABR4J402_9EURO
MERPLKRKRLSLSPEPESENEDDPGHVDLQQARAQNDLRLKSIFEGIFEKYGRDFTNVGDEIDLQTGNILVNNGHLHALDDGDNAGTIQDWLFDPQPSTPSIEQAGRPGGDNATARHNTQKTGDCDPDGTGKHSGCRVSSRLSQLLHDPPKSQEKMNEGASTTSEAEDDRSSVDSLLDTALCVQGTHAEEVGTGETTVTEKAITRDEETNQSQGAHNGKLDETVDPIWRVPEISVKLTTPTMLNRSISRPIVTTARSGSPPGAGSLWTLPSQPRRNTDDLRRKQKGSPEKRKNHPPKPVACDWSFAEAPDGSESDDPLQDYAPSPNPKGAVYIREKRKDPFTEPHTKNTCNYCKKSFSEKGYVSHLQAVLSDPTDSEHDPIGLEKELDMLTGQSASESVRSRESRTPGSKSLDPLYELTTTTTRNKSARSTIGPDEARLIMQMRVAQGMKWKEILHHFPQRKLSQLQLWYSNHWNERQANPPRLSRPWSKDELKKLGRLKDKLNVTWPGIRTELPGRSQAEVEFELLQLWAGGNGGST